MYFVVDDESPIVTGEEREMWEVFLPVLFSILSSTTPVGEDLIGAHSDGRDIFALACVFADHLGGNVRLVDNLVDPLAHRDRVGSEDQRGPLHRRHRDKPDDRLTGTAGEHDDAATSAWRSASIKRSRGRVLVGTRLESLAL